MLISDFARRAPVFHIVRWCPLLPALFLLALLLPTELSFNVGSLRLSPYRVVLIFAFFPAVSKVFSGKVGRVNAIDWLVLAHMTWAFFVINYYHGFDVMLESGGIRFIEFAGAYFLARAYISGEREYQGAVAFAIMMICLICPLLVLESVTGFNPLREFLSGGAFVNGMDKRMGLSRAFGPFDHPILLGVFAASVLGVGWLRVFPRLGKPRPRKSPIIWVVLSALSSLSAGATSALMTQFTLLLWESKTRLQRNRWKIFSLLLLALYVFIDIFSNRTPMKVLLHYLTFSAETAYGRIMIFEWGMADVWRNPILGIGFNEWTRPHWKSASMDNFWLLQAVTFGFPGFLTIALPSILACALGWRTLPPRLVRLRTGWVISMVGMIIAACTVHFWNNIFSYYAFFLGMGVWFINSKREALVGQVSADNESTARA